MLKQDKTELQKYSIDIAAIQEIVWKGSGVQDTGKLILKYSGNGSNTFGNSLLINRKQASNYEF